MYCIHAIHLLRSEASQGQTQVYFEQLVVTSTTLQD
jgi:hypothetical protein